MKFSHFLVLLLFFLSCKNEISTPKSEPNSKLKYITKVKWTENPDSVFFKFSGKSLAFSKKELPLKSAMVVPTSVLAYMDELDLNSKITGISQPDFVYNEKISKLFEENKIREIGAFNEIFIEKILVDKAGIFISTTNPILAKFHQQLENEGIKVLLIDEYEELNPLAKAEYVKIIGALFGKEKEADSIFMEIEKNYLRTVKLVKENSKKFPSVLVNQIYGDVWYLPGGKSFQAKLIEDAGGNYLWKNDAGINNLNLSFESVFEKAAEADIWINAGDYDSKQELLATYPNYEWFSALKKNQIYNWNKRKNAKGANDYFETGTARPDLILKDLAAIFHPELFPEHKLYFYKKLE
jgi:iron complex transport system substrate-binding protein